MTVYKRNTKQCKCKIFVKKFTQPLFWEQEFYAKNAQIATLPNLRQKSVNALKWPNSRQKSVINIASKAPSNSSSTLASTHSPLLLISKDGRSPLLTCASCANVVRQQTMYSVIAKWLWTVAGSLGATTASSTTLSTQLMKTSLCTATCPGTQPLAEARSPLNSV